MTTIPVLKNLALGLGVAGLLAVSAGVVQAEDSNPGILPPNSQPYGKSYTQWSEEHWKWLYSIPADNHPVYQDGSIDLSAYQPPGHVWFLVGSFSVTPVPDGYFATANRTGTVPADTALFFPIIDAEASTAEGNGTTRVELRKAATGFLPPPLSLACEIDGQPVHNLAAYRVTSPLFTWGPLPDNNLLGLDAGKSSSAVSDGYFLMLAPLSAGQHTIHFAASAGKAPGIFSLDITYHLTVQAGRAESEEDD